MTQNSEKRRVPSQWRDLLLYLAIAVVLVGAEVIGLLRGWPGPSLRVAGSVFSTIILTAYLVKVFASRVRSLRFWVALTLLLVVHVLWSLAAPFLVLVFGMGVELFLLGVVLRQVLLRRV